MQSSLGAVDPLKAEARKAILSRVHENADRSLSRLLKGPQGGLKAFGIKGQEECPGRCKVSLFLLFHHLDVFEKSLVLFVVCPSG